MPWPIVTIAAKVVSIKFIKGALFGFGRYIYKVVAAKPIDGQGKPLKGLVRLSHNIRNGAAEKENLIFLILMLGNVLFGLQELCLWCWDLYAKRLYNQFWTGMPSALDDPVALSVSLKDKSWHQIMPKIGRWLAIASLVYWPKPEDNAIKLTPVPDKRWLEVRYRRFVYLIRIDKQRELSFAGMRIRVSNSGNVIISSECGQFQGQYCPVAINKDTEW